MGRTRISIDGANHMTTPNNVAGFPRSLLVPTRHTKRRARFSLGVVALAMALGFFWGAAIGVLV